MSLEKQAALVRRLVDKTRSGEMEWKPSVADDAFQVSLKNFTIRIRTESRQNDDGEYVSDYIVEVINSDGDVADSFSDVDLFNDEELSERGWFPIMRDLHERARRSVLGADKALDEILLELGDDDLPF